ncbi:MAG: N-acetylglucosamine-6-phosphate deacetylase [Chloroflexi bacterium]|uniref:N-acetylglucosamine-6-phosphate deacetylase n=1 Tax=Candidatus Chlorohelix allophototropha TaxID=3003348 RepID=A0A8T7M1U0_9CHLR|nr:N-acetylglucosamine-6-phosphate deacetylase [Chloroflexota bacterium]WJW67600.1 N-acetylglucosamine-6-phosphate deacetylase [Chloroflexota bacterium L227-S17]
MQEFSISGQLWTEEGFRAGRLTISDGKIQGCEYGEGLKADYSFPDSYVCPGLIDMQINGGLGFDFTQQPNSVGEVAKALPRWGVTAFLPTYITAPIETYFEALGWLKANAATTKGAIPLGAHIEGPFLNPRYKGAHEETFLRHPSLEETHRLWECAGDCLKLMTLAPELVGALEVANWLHEKGIIVSAGHTAATYEEGLVAFESGIRLVTHLFNAMPSLHHRKPGIVGVSLAAKDTFCGIIVDGIHLHPGIVRLVYRLKGAANILLVTDAMAGMGMPPGKYVLGGQEVIVTDKTARLANFAGTLAGSILTLNQAIANMIVYTDCSVAEAVGMASLNPARLLGIDKRKGRLEAGYDADIAVFKPDNFETLMTLVNGEILYN